MLKFSKKFLICPFFGFLVFLAGIFLFNIGTVRALSPDVRQVKISGRPVVYYLNHATHQRKAYINAAVYLDYGNSWSEVKTISPTELAKWTEARLVKVAGDNNIYYIKDGRKIRMRNQQDLINYHLVGVTALTVSAFDLSQYQEETWPPLNATTTPPVATTTPPVATSSASALSLRSEPLATSTLVAGTNDNEIMDLHLQSGNRAVIIQRLTFDFRGLFSDGLVKKVRIYSANGQEYRSGNNRENSQLTVNIYQDKLYLPANSEAVLKVKIDLETCDNCTNQNIYARLDSAEAVAADTVVTGNFPLDGPSFPLMSSNSIIGQVKITEDAASSTSSKLLGRFTVSEESGREDVYIKRLVFDNLGTAGSNNLKNFKLKRGEDVIATADAMVNGDIDFTINYLRVSQQSSLDLTIVASAGEDYESGLTANLRLKTAMAVGKTFGLSLPVEIIDLDNTIVLP